MLVEQTLEKLHAMNLHGMAHSLRNWLEKPADKNLSATDLVGLLFDELAQARADGTHPHVLKRLAKAQVLILDDFGLEPLGAAERKELLEVLEDRYRLSAPW
jgi:hypothetical protein